MSLYRCCRDFGEYTICPIFAFALQQFLYSGHHKFQHLSPGDCEGADLLAAILESFATVAGEPIRQRNLLLGEKKPPDKKT